MMAYAPQVAEYFGRSNPVPGADLRGEAGSMAQGALISVGAAVVEGRLQSVGFRVFACPHIIAACHRAAELLEGAPPEALLELPLDELQQEFEIPVEKAGKLLILKDALANCFASGEIGVAR